MVFWQAVFLFLAAYYAARDSFAVKSHSTTTTQYRQLRRLLKTCRKPCVYNCDDLLSYENNNDGKNKNLPQIQYFTYGFPIKKKKKLCRNLC